MNSILVPGMDRELLISDEVLPLYFKYQSSKEIGACCVKKIVTLLLAVITTSAYKQYAQ